MRVLLLSTVLLLGACGPPDRPWCESRAPLPELRACASCAPKVRSRLNEPDLSRSLDIAFVAEGFEADQLGDFDRLTTTWLSDFEARVGAQVPGLVPRLNAWWIDLSDLAPSDGFALGTCMQRDVPDRGVRPIADSQRLDSLVTLPGIDVVVVVVNSSFRFVETGGLPWGSTRPIVMANSLTDSDGFAHELGHSLFGLHDEYALVEGGPELAEARAVSEPDMLASEPSVFFSPNVSLDSHSPKFGGAEQGVPGGMGFRAGVFHRHGPCLMNEGAGELCPLCQRAARLRVDQPLTNPRCGLRVKEALDGRLLATISSFDWDGLAQIRVRGRELHSYEPGGALGVNWHQLLEPADGFPVEATCVDRLGQESSVRLDL